MRVTPTLPQRGRQPKGGIPLTPSFFGGLFSTFLGIIAIGGMPERRGLKHDVLESPRAIDYFFLGFQQSRISLKKLQLNHRRVVPPGTTTFIIFLGYGVITPEVYSLLKYTLYPILLPEKSWEHKNPRSQGTIVILKVYEFFW
jgi:hypothetical protein